MPDATGDVEGAKAKGAEAAAGQMGIRFEAPRVGSRRMPQWSVAALSDAPKFTAVSWFALLGPGLVMGAAAIGGGEWLVGPLVTAKYGGALMWLAAISILAQALYNIEISRYTLYTGEPIFTGKFRTLPGPHVWLLVYLLLDFGSIFPYLAANAATPVSVLLLGGEMPDPDKYAVHWWMNKVIASVIFLAAMTPLVFGGKIYNSLKAIMGFKLVMVIGFLLVLAVFYSTPATWGEIIGGFFKVGNVPVQRGEDRNGNGVLDAGEDWDGDGVLDVVEGRGKDWNKNNKLDAEEKWGSSGVQDAGERDASQTRPLEKDEQGVFYVDLDGDGYRDGDNVENIFATLFKRGEFPAVDFTLIAFIAALASIAGCGGLTNTPISNYTRDQGWGMGRHVGAIPSIVGGRGITLSHVGAVFEPNEHSLPRWRRWYRHVVRDQMAVWAPACFVGVALPSMLSVEFLRRGTDAGQWNAAAMTAEGVRNQVANPPEGVLATFTGVADVLRGEAWGNLFWGLTLFCGFLVLAPSMAVTVDGILRRWVDLFWTASGRLRKMDPGRIRHVYFAVLIGYGVFGFVMLWLNKPSALIKFATIVYNFALGFSCWHSLAVNLVLLPRPLRPGWLICLGMMLAGAFFTVLGAIASLHELGLL